MLMRDFGERSLIASPSPDGRPANRTFAAIQVACSADFEPWWRLMLHRTRRIDQARVTDANAEIGNASWVPSLGALFGDPNTALH